MGARVWKTEAGWGPEAGDRWCCEGWERQRCRRELERATVGRCCRGAGEALSTSARQLAGHQRWFPLGEVLGGRDVVSSDLGLLRRSRGQLFVLDLGFGHVVVPGVKILLLEKRRDRKNVRTQNVFSCHLDIGDNDIRPYGNSHVHFLNSYPILSLLDCCLGRYEVPESQLQLEFDESEHHVSLRQLKPHLHNNVFR